MLFLTNLSTPLNCDCDNDENNVALYNLSDVTAMELGLISTTRGIKTRETKLINERYCSD